MCERTLSCKLAKNTTVQFLPTSRKSSNNQRLSSLFNTYPGATTVGTTMLPDWVPEITWDHANYKDSAQVEKCSNTQTKRSCVGRILPHLPATLRLLTWSESRIGLAGRWDNQCTCNYCFPTPQVLCGDSSFHTPKRFHASYAWVSETNPLDS